jgi:hypothetical protein
MKGSKNGEKTEKEPRGGLQGQGSTALKEEKTTVEIAEIYDIHQPGHPVEKTAAGESL